jgi:hypothetical protein
VDPPSSARTPHHKGTPKEDAKLTEAVTKIGIDGVQVVVLVPGRTNVQCRQRRDKVLDPDINQSVDRTHKGRWRPEEDAMLSEVVTASAITESSELL